VLRAILRSLLPAPLSPWKPWTPRECAATYLGPDRLSVRQMTVLPVALTHEPHRWALRAVGPEGPRHFVLHRLTGFAIGDEPDAPPEDPDWQGKLVTVRLKPREGLKAPRRIELQYGMTNGILEVGMRRAFVVFSSSACSSRPIWSIFRARRRTAPLPSPAAMRGSSRLPSPTRTRCDPGSLTGCAFRRAADGVPRRATGPVHASEGIVAPATIDCWKVNGRLPHPRGMRPIGLRPAPFTRRSDLRPIVLRMIAMNSLAAFTAEVSRSVGPAQARAAAGATPAAPAAAPQRKLDALPPPPASPLPRGSLLDLRV
jgi:hypothetical protein